MNETKNKKNNRALKGLLTLGFLLQAPNPVLADSGWHEEAFPTTISYANMSSKERNEAGFLAALNSEELSGNKSWSYEIKEAGDYQIATSWIEVLSKGEVKVTMSINGKVVKTLKAADGTVIEQIRKGYQLNERLVRPASVIVATATNCEAEQKEIKE